MKTIKSDLGNRMKEFEINSRLSYPDKSYIVERSDGNSFSHFLKTIKDLKKPFDDRVIEAMDYAMLKKCETTANAKFGFTQSDEISIVYTDTHAKQTQSTEGGEVLKLVSKGASKSSTYFNQKREEQDLERVYQEFSTDLSVLVKMFKTVVGNDVEQIVKMCLLGFKEQVSNDVIRSPKAVFDSRTMCFNIDEIKEFDYWKEKIAEDSTLISEPLDRIEAHNNIFWRFDNCVRNSKSSLAQAHFSHKQLHKKSCNDMLEMLLEVGIDWNLLDDKYKYGCMCVREEVNGRLKWVVKPMLNIKDKSIREEFYNYF